ncbi:translational GTPase TypA [Gammaproteobacteria bacterium]|nr:translational GTPase TypA [Gammaproteobacteria bacterium]
MTDKIRNIAIIAHVDHGKTTLVDKLLQQSGTKMPKDAGDRVMDRNELEKERGITILSKNTAIDWNGYRVNIVDTPGHADFGGEVERVLSMVDSVLLLVDAVDGPMPQTRFVTRKAFENGLSPIVVINKVDRPGARVDWVQDQIFDLFDRLGATDEQLDFVTVYASALKGFAMMDMDAPQETMDALFQTVVDVVPPPPVDVDGPLQLRISTLEYSSYVGIIGVARIQRGRIRRNQSVVVIDRDGVERPGKIGQLYGFVGLEKVEIDEASAGQIIAVSGIEGLQVSETICDASTPEALTPLTVDEPTLSVVIQINDSPFVGKEGKFITSRQIRDRLMREAEYNVALRVEDTDNPDKFRVSGRGELHLSVLLETMRREGFELAVSRPQIVTRVVDGVLHEPWEELVADIENEHQGPAIDLLGQRGGLLQDMKQDGDRIRLTFHIPSRGLIGFQNDFATSTSGTGIAHHVFESYRPASDMSRKQRNNGVMVSMAQGKILGYALMNLQERGKLFVKPGDEAYEGMIVGLHSRDNDLVVNPLKAKQLTNVRASGKDENVLLAPPVKHSLEQAIGFIEDDELVELTPQSIRLRKRFLKEHERKRASR